MVIQKAPRLPTYGLLLASITDQARILHSTSLQYYQYGTYHIHTYDMPGRLAITNNWYTRKACYCQHMICQESLLFPIFVLLICDIPGRLAVANIWYARKASFCHHMICLEGFLLPTCDMYNEGLLLQTFDMPGRLSFANIWYARKGLLLPTYDMPGMLYFANIWYARKGFLLLTSDMSGRLAIISMWYVWYARKQSCGSGIIESGYGSESSILSESGYGYGFGSNPDPGFWNWRKKYSSNFVKSFFDQKLHF